MALFGKKRATRKADVEDGEEQGYDDAELDPSDELEDVRAGEGHFFELGKPELAKYVRQRWDRQEDVARRVGTELKVNKARYEGHAFAQIHPNDPNRIYMPENARQKQPPTINKIRRAVHRYVAQVTADEPVIEGVPANHSDDARDAAEATTSALQGEWQRMNLHRALQRVTQIAAVMRSGFWMFEWDGTAGGRTKAQKFFLDPDGQRRLDFVDRSGARVKEDDAAEIWQGNMVVDVLTPMNVRWVGSAYAHEASELLVGKIPTLRQLYETYPETKKAKVSDLLAGVPPKAEEWLRDLRGEAGLMSLKNGASSSDEVDLDGTQLSHDDSRLDEPVFLLRYFHPRCRDYQDGFEATVAGKYLVKRGKLRYGIMPVIQFKVIDEVGDPLGLGLVDILRDPAELLDFVNGNILRFLQMMKRRWFVPLYSGVKARDLKNPTTSIIHYNPSGGAPTAEATPEMPVTLPQVADRFDREFDDQMGIHETARGIHVPGVTSGRQAEALRAGDETILGLTRTQLEESLVAGGRVMTEIIKVEWSAPRRIEYFEGREYLERAFSKADFGDTRSVRLKKGTLLMMDPAQKLEALFNYAEMGAITTQELRMLAPLADTAGISVTEDPHYQRARREGRAFLDGPSPELLQAREVFEREVGHLNKQTQDLQTAVTLGAAGTPDGQTDVSLGSVRVQQELAQVTQAWETELKKFVPTASQWELNSPSVSQVHMTQHMADLAKDKVSRLPDWWVMPFVEHTLQHMQTVQAVAQAQPTAAPAKS